MQGALKGNFCLIREILIDLILKNQDLRLIRHVKKGVAVRQRAVTDQVRTMMIEFSVILTAPLSLRASSVVLPHVIYESQTAQKCI